MIRQFQQRVLEEVAHQLRQWAVRLETWGANVSVSQPPASRSSVSQQNTNAPGQSKGQPPTHWVKLVKAGGAAPLLDTLAVEHSLASLVETTLDTDGTDTLTSNSSAAETEDTTALNQQLEPSSQNLSVSKLGFPLASRASAPSSASETPIGSLDIFKQDKLNQGNLNQGKFSQQSPSFHGTDRHWQSPSSLNQRDTTLLSWGYSSQDTRPHRPAGRPEQQSAFGAQPPIIDNRSGYVEVSPNQEQQDALSELTSPAIADSTTPVPSTTVRLRFQHQSRPKHSINLSPLRWESGQGNRERQHLTHPGHGSQSMEPSLAAGQKPVRQEPNEQVGRSHNRLQDAPGSPSVQQGGTAYDGALNLQWASVIQASNPSPDSSGFPSRTLSPPLGTRSQSELLGSRPSSRWVSEQKTSPDVRPFAENTDDPWPVLPEEPTPDWHQIIHLLESRNRRTYLEQEQQGTRWNGWYS